MKSLTKVMIALAIGAASQQVLAVQAFTSAHTAPHVMSVTTHSHDYVALDNPVSLAITEGQHATGTVLKNANANDVIGDDTFTAAANHDYEISQVTAGFKVTLSDDTTYHANQKAVTGATGGTLHIVTTTDTSLSPGLHTVSYTITDYAN
ncbi:TPA: hypothetical protein G8O67_005327 [Salmonella enterica]|uniref:Uncharacterized protein n=1 Tax=Salmonella enterica TaxID=28901 RepID=A0A756LHG6_SALER|nr:hypothetical protein [Salmonella enterica]